MTFKSEQAVVRECDVFRNRPYSALAMRDTGEHSAVDSKSGEPVHQSGPGLKRPTPPLTGGRKSPARPSASLQPKTGRGPGWNPGIEIEREALDTTSPSDDREAVALSDFEVSQLLDFFQLLDRWDREGHRATEDM